MLPPDFAMKCDTRPATASRRCCRRSLTATSSNDAVVVVEAGGVGAFGVDDAFDHRPMLIRLGVVGRVAGLRAGGAAADVDALSSGSAGAAARIVQKSRALGIEASSLRVEVRRRLGRRDVDDRRLSGDGHLSCSDATFISVLTVAVNPRPTTNAFANHRRQKPASS